MSISSLSSSSAGNSTLTILVPSRLPSNSGRVEPSILNKSLAWKLLICASTLSWMLKRILLIKMTASKSLAKVASAASFCKAKSFNISIEILSRFWARSLKLSMRCCAVSTLIRSKNSALDWGFSIWPSFILCKISIPSRKQRSNCWSLMSLSKLIKIIFASRGCLWLAT